MKRLTFQQHEQVGLQLKQANRLLMAASLTVSNYGGKSSRASKLIDKLTSTANLLRHELDIQIAQDCPDVENARLNRVYYGMTGLD